MDHPESKQQGLIHSGIEIFWIESPIGLCVRCPDLCQGRARHLDSKISPRVQAKRLDSSPNKRNTLTDEENQGRQLQQCPLQILSCFILKKEDLILLKSPLVWA